MRNSPPHVGEEPPPHPPSLDLTPPLSARALARRLHTGEQHTDKGDDNPPKPRLLHAVALGKPGLAEREETKIAPKHGGGWRVTK